MIECFGICSENCSAFQNGKCILDAKKAETKNDFELYEEDEIGIKGNNKQSYAECIGWRYGDLAVDRFESGAVHTVVT